MSNAQHSVRVPRANDRTIIKFCEELEKNSEGNNFQIMVSGANSWLNKSDNQDVISELSKSKLYAISRTNISISGLNVIYHRGIFEPNNHSGGLVQTNSAIWDTVELRPPNQGVPDPAIAIRISEIISKAFPPSPASFSEEKLGSTEALIVAHSAMVEKLEQTLTDMAERYGNDRRNLEAEYDDRRKTLTAESDELRSKLYAEVDSERQSVITQRQEIEDRARDLDDRQNTHVRRDIRKELKAQLAEYKQAFALTKGTTDLRLPIHIAVWLLIVVLIGGVVFFATREQPTDGWAYLLFLAKPLGLTFVAVAIATWYINWMNRWFERHADVEFRLKELELDIDRASWLVETAFEWKKAGEEAMPDKMLEAIGRNLFAGRDEAPAAGLNPVDQLASALLGQASHAKLNLAGHQLEFDRKALKQAGKGE